LKTPQIIPENNSFSNELENVKIPEKAEKVQNA